MPILLLSPANSEIPAWLDYGASISLKAESMCTMKTVIADSPWWRQNVKQFCITGVSRFRKSLVNYSRFVVLVAWNRFPVAGKRFHIDGEVQAAVTSWLQTLAVDSYNTSMHWCTDTINASITVMTMLRKSQWISVNNAIKEPEVPTDSLPVCFFYGYLLDGALLVG